jgi:PAS domain S-box-containing protein
VAGETSTLCAIGPPVDIGAEESAGYPSVKALFDTLDAAVLKLSADGRIETINSACRDLTGFELSAIKGRHVCDAFVPPEDRAQVVEHLSNVLRHVSHIRFESRLVTRQGTYRHFRWSGSAVVGNGSAETYVVLTGIDFTSEREALTRLSHAESLLTRYKRQLAEREAAKFAGRESGIDRRNATRRSYPYEQSVAPIYEHKLPPREAFQRVRCHNISSRGISFLSEVPPDYEELVIGLGHGNFLTYLTGRVIHVTISKVDGREVYIVGSAFAGRARY